MCCIYGFLDYGKKISHRKLKNLLRELSIAAEIRGTDATGIAYIDQDSNLQIIKQPKPAHKMNLSFPDNTTAVIGHTRFTTQGSEKKNYNNHPFDGCNKGGNIFALAHNGIIYNEKSIREKHNIAKPKIETDSYISVQILEQCEELTSAEIAKMCEEVDGSFVFNILRTDNTIFIAKGSNPITIYHFEDLGLYVYASTKEILNRGIKTSKIKGRYKEIILTEGDILQINPDGTTENNLFKVRLDEYFKDINPWLPYADSYDYEMDTLMNFCELYGITEEDIEYLELVGYSISEITDMLDDIPQLYETIREAKECFDEYM